MMADYFQDILPPDGAERRPAPPPRPETPPAEAPAAEKSIRNVNITCRITTTAGRIDDRTIRLRVRDR
jgi:hypothetical protein